jgi:uncharacterized protein (TIGR02217 family)
MSANLTVFPLDVGQFGSSIRYQTDITVGRNGQEVRNAVWQDPLFTYNAAFNIKTYDDIATLQAFFHLCKGREQSFLVKDYADYSISRTSIGTGDDSDTTFQIVKKYTEGVLGTYTRTITKPTTVEGSTGVRVWVDNSEVTGANFSVSGSTGIITLTSPPPMGKDVEMSCALFYVPVRFDVDELPIELLNYWVSGATINGLVEIPEIRLVEVRGE